MTVRFCAKHWLKVQKSFGFAAVEDVVVRMRAIVADYGFDAFVATTVEVLQIAARREDVLAEHGSLFNLQIAVEAAGGCIVCFVDDEKLLDDAIENVRRMRKRRVPA